MALEERIKNFETRSKEIPKLKTENLERQENESENEKKLNFQEKTSLDSEKIEIQNSQQAISNSSSSFREKRAEEIDQILESGLSEVFLKLDSKQQKVFKEKGEETVLKINLLLDKTKIKVNKIINLIKTWLKLIPGINKFFLEQEAKIKADKIIKIKNKL